MKRHHSQFGKLGEDIVARYLTGNGYSVLRRNYRAGHAEIDIIAQKSGELIVVEVKTRTAEGNDMPEKAVGKSKQRNLKFAIEQFLEENEMILPVRFDIINVIRSDKFEIEHFEDAFYPFDVY